MSERTLEVVLTHELVEAMLAGRLMLVDTDNPDEGFPITAEVEEDVTAEPCRACGRTDLPLHTNYQCPECWTPQTEEN